jgi:hypothetical protein
LQEEPSTGQSQSCHFHDDLFVLASGPRVDDGRPRSPNRSRPGVPGRPSSALRSIPTDSSYADQSAFFNS